MGNLKHQVIKRRKGQFSNIRGEREHGITDGEMWELRESCKVCEIRNTHTVFLSREEAESYGKSRGYNFKDGWRVYCISLYRTSSTKYILSAIDTDNLKFRRQNGNRLLHKKKTKIQKGRGKALER